MRGSVIFGVIATVGVLAGVTGPARAQTPTAVAYVTRVVDGNVVYAALPDRIEAIRYIGVAVPLVAHPTRGAEPYADVVREINRRLVEGKWIHVAFDGVTRDRHGRLPAYVWVDGIFVNAALLQWGYAEADPARLDTGYANYFAALEASARGARRGLWGYGDVLTYHRTRPADSAGDSDVYQRAADGSGGRVFSSPNPLTPATPPPGAGPPATPGGTSSDIQYMPTPPVRPGGNWPQPGTTYRPLPAR
jgi:micrococcal nuclease